MTWFAIALIAPLIWSIINHVDKYLISKYFHGGVGALMIFVGIIALPLSGIIYIFYPDVFSVSTFDIFILLLTGLLYNLGVLFYLFALEKDDTSVVIPFWQLVPVFGYFLGVALLGETFTQTKVLGGIITILGGILLTINLTGPKIKIRKSVFFLMICSSFILALGYILFKKASVDDYPFWISIFWNQVGMFIFGLLCFFVKSYRKEFFHTLESNKKSIITINILEQLGETVGIVVNNYAILIAPIATIVILVEYSAQPLFAFLEGILITIFFPKFAQEDISKKNLIIKFISIVIMTIGIYFVTK